MAGNDRLESVTSSSSLGSQCNTCHVPGTVFAPCWKQHRESFAALLVPGPAEGCVLSWVRGSWNNGWGPVLLPVPVAGEESWYR